MLQHYAKLKKKTDLLNKTGKHFTELNDLHILQWDRCWENMKPKNPKNSEGEKHPKWEAAAQNEVVFRRNADAIKARFKFVANKLGGLEKARVTIEPNSMKYEEWFGFFE